MCDTCGNKDSETIPERIQSVFIDTAVRRPAVDFFDSPEIKPEFQVPDRDHLKNCLKDLMIMSVVQS
jgi:hypothetical protein